MRYNILHFFERKNIDILIFFILHVKIQIQKLHFLMGKRSGLQFR